MNEAEWLASGDPKAMLALIQGKISDRKLRLFACACCRRVVPLLSDPELVRTLEVAERSIEQQASVEECRAASKSVFDHYNRTNPGGGGSSIDLVVAWAAALRPTGEYPLDYAGYVFENACRLGGRWIVGQPLSDEQQRERAIQAALLRDVVGNPFRPVAFPSEWRTDTAVSLARQMYDSREFSAMPILADALQDAGCDNDEVLSHCRTDGPHVRGCWVVDLVLEKE